MFHSVVFVVDCTFDAKIIDKCFVSYLLNPFITSFALVWQISFFGISSPRLDHLNYMQERDQVI